MPTTHPEIFRCALYWSVVKVGIIQSSFIPWRGYFDFIASVDIFIFYDDVQYSKGGWRNRNRIKCPDGTRWLTVPVRHQSLNQLIVETEIDEERHWRESHAALWDAAYGASPFFNDVLKLLGDMGRGSSRTISRLNIQLIRLICSYLDIRTPMMLSSEFSAQGRGTDRLVNLLRAVGAKTYLSGPSADNYLEKDKLKQAGIRLEYKSYDYVPYPQLWGAFEGAVSVLDLIANCGPAAPELIHSKTPNRVVVP